MPSVVIRLDPDLLANPDADLRYLFPDLLVERAGGVLVDDGYDYLDDNRMLLFLGTGSLEAALPIVLEVIGNADLLGNSFRSAVVAVGEHHEGPHEVVYPVGSTDEFPLA